MARCLESFESLITLRKPINVGLPDGRVKMVYKVGVVKVTPDIRLENVLFLPEFKHNLISLSRLLEKRDVNVFFDEHKCLIQNLSTKKELGKAIKVNGIYVLIRGRDVIKKEEEKKVFGAARTKEEMEVKELEEIKKMHARLGHCSLSKLKHISVCNYKGIKELFCDTCCLAKHHRMPFNVSLNMAKNVFDLVHMDLW
ncbi:Retrovirus-related Pol polyprotein from transposon RE1 [Bienertia sinuspersici]